MIVRTLRLPPTHAIFTRLFLCGVLCILVGCASSYKPPPPPTAARSYGTSKIVVKHGTPNARVERLTRIVDWPRRTFRPTAPNPREVSAETIEELVAYLEAHGLEDVTVYVNHYDPAEMWYRVVHNDRVGAGWRYTAGRLDLLGYRLIPPEVAARTEYDPYTNSIYLNTNAPVNAISAAAHARELHTEPNPGTSYAVHKLPGFAFFEAKRNFREVVRYAQARENWPLEQQAYRELCPRLGIESVQVGTYFTPVWWGGLALNAAGHAGGFVVGRQLEARRLRELELVAKQPEFAAPREPQAVIETEAAPQNVGDAPVVPVGFHTPARASRVEEVFSHEQWEAPVFAPRAGSTLLGEPTATAADAN